MSNSLQSLSDQLASTVEEAGRSTVAVHARRRFDSSGVHWTPGIVVTAEHTIRRDDDIQIITPEGASLSAELVGRDPGTDLAVLRAPGLLTPVVARRGKPAPRPGNIVLAVGRFKDSVSAAFGVVSSISGPSSTWRGGHLDQVVRLDLALHPGASGGAVVDAAGKLVGIATAALSRVSVFAIPVETVERVAGQLLAHGRIPRGYLGVGLQPIVLPEHLISRLQRTASAGVIVISVESDSPAARAGVLIGDILLELGGRAIHQTESILEILDSGSIGKQLTARILRGGALVEAQVTIAEKTRRD